MVCSKDLLIIDFDSCCLRKRITLPQVLQAKSAMNDRVLVQPWIASMKESSTEACSQHL